MYITSLYFVNNKSDLCNVSVIFFCFVVNFSIVHVFFGLVTFWTISIAESEGWSSQLIFQLKQLERRSLKKKIRASTGSPDFFQASSFQLLKLENELRWSFFTFIYNRSSNMNYFIYTSQYQLPCVTSTRSALKLNLVPWFSAIIYSFRSMWGKMRSVGTQDLWGHKKCFWFCSETFCVRNKCFPVYAAH